MEQQFILRLPDCLKNVDPKDCKLNRINAKEVTFCVKNTAYPGIICKLPTIVESQKLVENKLYKISDISTIVVVFENKGFNVDDEISKIESSGLTPPMSFVKERRFAKSSIRSEEVERIEKKVQALLAEDQKALKVEISNTDKDSSEADLDMLAAELEDELAVNKSSKAVSPNQIAKNNGRSTASIKNPKPIENSINKNVDSLPRANRVNSSPKAFSKKKDDIFEQATSFDALDHQNSNLQVEMPDISAVALTIDQKSVQLPDNKVDSTKLQEISSFSANNPITDQEGVSVNPKLADLLRRIEEKQQQYDKAVNPILKKRFEQALQSLKDEYEKQSKE